MYQQAQSRVQNGLNFQNVEGDKIKVVKAQCQKTLTGDIVAGLMHRCFFHRTISGKEMFTPCPSPLDTFFLNTIFKDYAPFYIYYKILAVFPMLYNPSSQSVLHPIVYTPLLPTPPLPFVCTSNHDFALYFCESASFLVIVTSLLYF